MNSKSELLLATNPVHKKVPVLLHGDRPVCESLVIVEYVDEAFDGPPLLPADPYERAMARSWARFFENKCLEPLRLALFGDGEAQRSAMEAARAGLALMEEQLKDTRFFGSYAIGLADIAGGGLLAHWLTCWRRWPGCVLMSGGDEEFAALRLWAAEYRSSEAVQACLPDRFRLHAYFAAVSDKCISVAKLLMPK